MKNSACRLYELPHSQLSVAPETQPLHTLIITNHAELTNQALTLCEKLQRHEPENVPSQPEILDLEEIMAHNNGRVAQAATQAASAEIILSFLHPKGYFPMYWKQWFRNWAAYRAQNGPGLLLGRIWNTAGPGDGKSPDMEAFYQEIAASGSMEFIPVTSKLSRSFDWSILQQRLTVPKTEESTVPA